MGSSDNQDSMYFGWADYLVFSLTLLISALVGIYHGWRGINSTSEYLMGGKTMGMFPIAMSLAASAISTGTMLGVPADIYLTGTMLFWSPVAGGVATLTAAYLILPIFHRLEVVSANQYLEMRFNRWIRRAASFLSLIKTLFFMATIVYGPSLALSQVTGIHVYLSVVIVFVVCIFYTAIGGIKAVVWTDTIQIFLMYGSMVFVVVKGIIDVGGWDIMWLRNEQSGRVEFGNIDLDPRTRHTVWGFLIGGWFYWLSFLGTEQTCVQRFLAIPQMYKAKRAMLINWICMAGIMWTSCVAGVVTYAKYFDCDPLSRGTISKVDQIIPHYVMETVGLMPGMPGFFVAGVFSGSLSSLSSGLSAAPLIVLEDFVRPFYPHMEDQTATRVTKVLSVAFGALCFGLTFLVAHVKTILEATVAIIGAFSGSGIGVFTLGMFVPWANSIGAGVGMVISVLLMATLGISTQLAKSHGLLRTVFKPFSTEGCPFGTNTTIIANSTWSQPPPETNNEGILSLMSISYMWYTMIGFLIVWIVGIVVSLATGCQDPDLLDPKLLCNIRQFFPCSSTEKSRHENKTGEEAVNQAIDLTEIDKSA